MEEIEFLKICKKICKKCNKRVCAGCELEALSCEDFNEKILQDMINFVNKWILEHPEKTMLQDFYEKHPNAPKNEYGVPKPCPWDCGYDENDACVYKDIEQDKCYQCWNRPLKE